MILLINDTHKFPPYIFQDKNVPNKAPINMQVAASVESTQWNLALSNHKTIINITAPSHNRHQPIQYWQSKDQEEAKDWVLKSKDKDLITQRGMANGFEHNLVVVFQSQDPEKFYVNECMRSSAILYIVSIPEEQLESYCFGKCQSIQK